MIRSLILLSLLFGLIASKSEGSIKSSALRRKSYHNSETGVIELNREEYLYIYEKISF